MISEKCYKTRFTDLHRCKKTSSSYPIRFVAFFQRFPVLAESLVGQSAFRFEPHALHFVEIFHGRNTLPGELGTSIFRFFHSISPEHIFGAFRVDVAVGRVEGLGLVQPLVRLLGIAGVLQYFFVEKTEQSLAKLKDNKNKIVPV
jgi:hypothetical protein